MTFLLPAEPSPDAAHELERAWVAGPDHLPWPTRVRLERTRLLVERRVDESGSLAVPWTVQGAGRLMSTSATLIERPAPYQLVVELARGKVSQLRRQATRWQEDGLCLPAEVKWLLDRASRALCAAVATSSVEEANQAAQLALDVSTQAGEQLVQDYTHQALGLRHACQPCLATALGCRVGTALDTATRSALAKAFPSIALAYPWSRIESNQGHFDWEEHDALLDWAEKQGLAVTGGPLVDFSAVQLPGWLWLWERDLTSLGKFLSTYVAAALKRYRGRIRRWHLTSASNSASVLSLSEHELLWLTVKAARVARQVDPELELIVGIAQPWCDYMARADRDQSAPLFAETLVRELNLAALDLEVVMGVTPRGSYCRDLLETSQLLDSYADLGVPLRLTLGYPSSKTVDVKADPELYVDGGHWHGTIEEATQAEWATAFTTLALSKPYVQAVHWVHFNDADVHQFPHCGLVDGAGKPKGSLRAFQQLREQPAAPFSPGSANRG